jgi:hypothetical protein
MTDRSPSGNNTGTSTKSGEVRLVLWAQPLQGRMTFTKKPIWTFDQNLYVRPVI